MFCLHIFFVWSFGHYWRRKYDPSVLTVTPHYLSSGICIPQSHAHAQAVICGVSLESVAWFPQATLVDTKRYLLVKITELPRDINTRLDYFITIDLIKWQLLWASSLWITSARLTLCNELAYYRPSISCHCSCHNFHIVSCWPITPQIWTPSLG